MQIALSEVIKDESFIHHYIQENQKRLLQAYQICTTTLDRLNIPYVGASAGMFIWVDLSCCLHGSGWEAEEDLFQSMVQDSKLVLTPGESNHADKPGYFRICYAFFHSIDVLVEGMRRLEGYVLAHRTTG